MGDISDKGVKKAERAIRVEQKNEEVIQIEMTVGEQKKKVLELLVLGVSVDEACRLSYVKKLTFLGWLSRDDSFKQQYNNSKKCMNEYIALRAKQKLMDLIEDGNASSVQFALRNLDVDFKPVEAKEIVVKDDSKLPIEHETSIYPVYHDGAEGSLIVTEDDVTNG